MSRRGGAGFALALTLALASAPDARADTWSEIGDKGPNDPKLAVRTTRDGLVMGLSIGVGASGASGYPNASSEIGDPNYYSSSNLLLDTGWKLFVMGAIADYVNFGAWGGSESGKSND